ncbi:hypothetical protein DXG01_015713 [Tephrocybe rancida]|nr:hypothetical protein DXG01_015713 [Tephrocybe rancida]
MPFFYGKTFTQTQQTNATISLDFDGVPFSVFGFTNGTFVANIDGKNYYGTTLPSSSAQPAALFSVNSIGPGKHTVTITNLDEDGILYIDYHDVDKRGVLRLHIHIFDALGLYGTVGPDHGSYSVQLDDQPQHSFRATHSTPATRALLYYTSQLEAGNHTLHVVNQDDAVFDVDWINLASVNVTATSPVTDPSSTSGAPTATSPGAIGTSRISIGAIVGATVGGVVALLLSVLVILVSGTPFPTNACKVDLPELALSENLKGKIQSASKASIYFALYYERTAIQYFSGEYNPGFALEVCRLPRISTQFITWKDEEVLLFQPLSNRHPAR